jgi:catechol 2,3-dioxygenase-like lactoylglutathione lyase family enzyme
MEDCMPIARLSHIGFNIPRELFDQECDFWENVIGLTKTHSIECRNAFFAADALRDHEFILFATDETVAGHGQPGCIANHVAFDVATDAEVNEFTERLRARGYDVVHPGRGRARNRLTSPAGIPVEINTPPYAHARGRDVGSADEEGGRVAQGAGAARG